MTLTDALHDDPVAGPRDGFAQMLAALDAQLDRDLAGPALLVAKGPAAPAAAALPVPWPRPAPRAEPASRSMLAPAAAVVVTIGVVGCAAILIALHWRPTRWTAAGMPAAPAMAMAARAPNQSPAAVAAPLALATRVDAGPTSVEATPAASSCTQAQTALGLCTTLATRANPTTTPESSP